MAELSTKTGTDVAYEVKREFGDEDGVQVVDADLIKWINSAQRKIVAINPILQRSVVHDLTAGVQAYSYPADRVQYIQSLSYRGTPLEGYSYQEAQEYILKNRFDLTSPDTTSGIPRIWWSWAQSIMFWPIPDTTETGVITMDFVAIPEDIVVLTDALDLPDRYFDSVVEQVMMRAHLLNEDWDAANFSKGQFNEALGTLSEQENRIRLNTYKTITVRAEDAW